MINVVPSPFDDAVNVRRREFERLQKDVAEMRVQLTQEEDSPENKVIVLKKVCKWMGLNPDEVFK